MKLFVLNSKPADPNGYIFQALVRALIRQHKAELVLLDPLDLGQIPEDPESQALLVYGGEELRRIPSHRLHGPFGRRAIWFTEDPYELAHNREQAALFSSVYTNDSGSVTAYPYARHLPLAADAELIPLSLHRTASRLAFFSGTAWPNRKRLLQKLRQNLSEVDALDIHLVANPVVEERGFERGLGTGLNFSQPIPITEFTLRAARSLCTLVIGRDFSGSGAHVFSRSPGPRLFEAGLTGSCQLVHAGEIPDMPADLLEGVHYLRFHHFDELCGLLRQCRTEPQRFQVIGAAMADRIRTHHTYDQRAQVLLEGLAQCPSKPIDLTASIASNRRFLFVTHEKARPGFHHGGAGLCMESILAAAPADAEIRVLCRAGDDGRRFELLDSVGEAVGGFRCRQPVDQYSLHHPEFEQYFERLLADWKPRLVHVNHLIGFTPAVLPLARRSGAKVLLTLHDYFLLCDSWNLLDANQSFCDLNDFYDSRCFSCTAARLPQFSNVQPLERRVLMAEVITHAHQLIVPSAAAEAQLRKIFSHLPTTAVIEPVLEVSAVPIPAATGDSLIVLIPGNLAPNKGSVEFFRLLEQVERLELPIRFRVLGRADAGIRRQLADHPRVELLGRYAPGEFSALAGSSDLALFLSPWPETYCITFDEWAQGGRPSFFIAIGALAEPHRQQELHPASRSFELGDGDALLAALIQATTSEGLAQLRRPWSSAAGINTNHRSPVVSFGERHWELYDQVLASVQPLRPIQWQARPHKHLGEVRQFTMGSRRLYLKMFLRSRLRRVVYGLPSGHRLVRRWRQMRGG